MASNIRSVADLLKHFTVDATVSAPRRLAEFLDEAARVLPRRFVDRRVAARIAFALPRTPSEGSEDVKRLGQLAGRTKEVLLKEYRRTFITDRVDGYRASVDDTDMVVTGHRRARSRVVSSIKSLVAIDSAIDIQKVKGGAKDELARARKAQAQLESYQKSVPLLPPAKEEGK